MTMLYDRPEAGRNLFPEGFDIEKARLIYNCANKDMILDPLVDQLNFNPMEQYILKYALGDTRVDRALDIGCNNGRFALSVIKHNKVNMCIGIDISDEAIKSAKRNIHLYDIPSDRISFINSPIETFTCEYKFDLVTMNDTLEHVYSPRKILDKINRLLKISGLFGGMVPYMFHCDSDVHLHHFDERSLASLLFDHLNLLNMYTFAYPSFLLDAPIRTDIIEKKIVFICGKRETDTLQTVNQHRRWL